MKFDIHLVWCRKTGAIFIFGMQYALCAYYACPPTRLQIVRSFILRKRAHIINLRSGIFIFFWSLLILFVAQNCKHVSFVGGIRFHPMLWVIVVIVIVAGCFSVIRHNQKIKMLLCPLALSYVIAHFVNCAIAHQYSARTSFAHAHAHPIMAKIVLILGNIDSNNNNDFKLRSTRLY